MDIKTEEVYANVFVHIPAEKTFTQINIKKEEAHDGKGSYICTIV